MTKTNKELKSSYIVTIVIILFILILLGILTFFSGRTTSNPPGTIGNTPGNLNNGGLFCEYNNTIYFSNPLDNATLYAMNPDESDIRKLGSVKVRNILAGGDYLYYFQLGSGDASGFGDINNTHSFNRCDLKGRHAMGLTRDVVVNAQLVNDSLYLLTAGKDTPLFYKFQTDKTGKTELAKYSVNPSCAYDGMIYYNGTQDDHALYRLDTTTDVTEQIWNGNIWNPVLHGEYIYYMDLDSNYSLCRYSLSSKTVDTLTTERVECFNTGSGYIYYQTNDAINPQLKCMHTDGSNCIVIAEGNYTNISMTSQYVYFQEFNDEDSLYHARLGSDNVSDFNISISENNK